MLKKSFLPVIALALGHLVTDMQAGALPIVLPHLKELFALSYAQLALIVLTQNITSSVIQPVFGYVTDKKSLPGMLPFCAAMAGAGFAFIGWAPSYALVLATVVVIGVASATYHPQASKTVNFLSDEGSKARNMGIFSLGGNAGMAAGSILMTLLLSLEGGLHNTMYFVLPGLLVFGLMVKYMPYYKRVTAEHACKQAQAKTDAAGSKVSQLGIGILLLFIFLRSTIHTGIYTYFPLYVLNFRAGEEAFASMLVSLFMLGGVAGTYIGAVLSDKFGSKKVIAGSALCSIPSVGLFLAASSSWSIMASMLASGFCIFFSFATTIVLAQSLMPDKVGMAAGLTLGFGVGCGGVGVILLGVLADYCGLEYAVRLLAFLPILAAAAALRIPEPKTSV